MMVQTYKNMLHSFSSAGVNINIPPRWGAHVGVPPAAPAVCLMLLCPVITLDHGGRWLSRFLNWHHVLDAVTAAVVRSISQSCECRDHPVFVFFFWLFLQNEPPERKYWTAQAVIIEKHRGVRLPTAQPSTGQTSASGAGLNGSRRGTCSSLSPYSPASLS